MSIHLVSVIQEFQISSFPKQYLDNQL